MLTSQSQQLNMKNTEKVGSNCYLSKPINNSSLYNALVKICSDKNENLVITDKIKKSPQYNGSVLVVEDNIINQKVAVGLLRKFGITVFVAANGVEALATLEKIPVDLIFMDCQMPVMDGLEATIQIRNPNSKVLNHDVTIIALTANALDADREKCSEVGMNDFLSKPIDMKKLQTLLNANLKESMATFVS
jgi:CheY-like chemotaxis protein